MTITIVCSVIGAILSLIAWQLQRIISRNDKYREQESERLTSAVSNITSELISIRTILATNAVNMDNLKEKINETNVKVDKIDTKVDEHARILATFNPYKS